MACHNMQKILAQKKVSLENLLTTLETEMTYSCIVLFGSDTKIVVLLVNHFRKFLLVVILLKGVILN